MGPNEPGITRERQGGAGCAGGAKRRPPCRRRDTQARRVYTPVRLLDALDGSRQLRTPGLPLRPVGGLRSDRHRPPGYHASQQTGHAHYIMARPLSAALFSLLRVPSTKMLNRPSESRGLGLVPTPQGDPDFHRTPTSYPVPECLELDHCRAAGAARHVIAPPSRCYGPPRPCLTRVCFKGAPDRFAASAPLTLTASIQEP